MRTEEQKARRRERHTVYAVEYYEREGLWPAGDLITLIVDPATPKNPALAG